MVLRGCRVKQPGRSQTTAVENSSTPQSEHNFLVRAYRRTTQMIRPGFAQTDISCVSLSLSSRLSAGNACMSRSATLVAAQTMEMGCHRLPLLVRLRGRQDARAHKALTAHLGSGPPLQQTPAFSFLVLEHGASRPTKKA